MNTNDVISWKISYYYLITVVFCISIVFSQFFPLFNDIKYVICALFLIYPIINQHSILLNEFEKILFKLFIFWTFFYLVHLLFFWDINAHFFIRSTKEYIFIVLPIISFIVASNYLNERKTTLIIDFFLYSLVFLEIIRNGFDITFILHPLKYLVDSQTNSESTYALLYGLLFIHFVSKGDTFKSILSLYLVLIGGKRLVLLALIGVAIVLPIIKFIVKKNLKPFFLFLLLFTIVVFILLGLSNGLFDDLIREYTGFGAVAFTKGRTTTYSIVLSHTSLLNFFGEGIGFSSYILERSNFKLLLMHSDILKIFVETGILGILIFTALLSKIATRNITLFCLAGYYALIMITDNPLIYIQVSIVFYTLVMFQFQKMSNEK